VAGVGRGAREKGRRGRGGEGRKKEGRRERKIFLLPKDFEITNNRLCPTPLSSFGFPPEAVLEAKIHLFIFFLKRNKRPINDFPKGRGRE